MTRARTLVAPTRRDATLAALDAYAARFVALLVAAIAGRAHP